MRFLIGLAWIVGGVAITWGGLLLAIWFGLGCGLAVAATSIAGGIVCVNEGFKKW